MIEIPKITQKIALKDYAPEFGDAQIAVWVNLPRKLVTELLALVDPLKKPDKELIVRCLGLIGQIWDSDETEVMALFDKSQDTDPVLFEWLIMRTMKLILEHRIKVKKNLMMLPINSEKTDTPASR